MVILSTSSSGLQNCLSNLFTYCKQWKLCININKSKVMIMSKSGKRYNDKIYIGNEEIELCTILYIFGCKFHSLGSFTLAQKELAQKALKATFLLKRANWQPSLETLPT